MKSMLLFGIALALLGLWSGCTSAPTATRPDGTPSKGISEIHLLAMPLALNLNTAPGADGFAVKVYAVDRAKAKTQPITQGRLELLMFDGLLEGPVPGTNTPHHVWAYDAAELPRYQLESIIGQAYEFTPTWTNNPPRQDQITIAARYLSPDHPPILSAPTLITVATP